MLSAKKFLSTSLVSATATAGLLLGVAAPASAAAYIKFDGVDGECDDKSHKGWIELESISMGKTKWSRTSPRGSAIPQRAGRSRAATSEIVLTTRKDAASPKLHQLCARGHAFKEIRLRVHTGSRGKGKWVEYRFKNVAIGSVQPTRARSGGRAGQLEAIRLEPAATRNAKPGNKGGNVEYTWKVEEGEASSAGTRDAARPARLKSTPVRVK